MGTLYGTKWSTKKIVMLLFNNTPPLKYKPLKRYLTLILENELGNKMAIKIPFNEDMLEPKHAKLTYETLTDAIKKIEPAILDKILDNDPPH